MLRLAQGTGSYCSRQLLLCLWRGSLLIQFRNMLFSTTFCFQDTKLNIMLFLKGVAICMVNDVSVNARQQILICTCYSSSTSSSQQVLIYMVIYAHGSSLFNGLYVDSYSYRWFNFKSACG
ncbi:unnamed protein product [Urochloa humidicola]